MSDIRLSNIDDKNLREIWELGYRKENPEWKEWDGPYFVDDYQKYVSYEDFKKNKGKFYKS